MTICNIFVSPFNPNSGITQAHNIQSNYIVIVNSSLHRPERLRRAVTQTRHAIKTILRSSTYVSHGNVCNQIEVVPQLLTVFESGLLWSLSEYVHCLGEAEITTQD